ncbi:hypothetical protein ABEB36_010875 [Hypothenemus hampei]|uniref:Uncharacterized protein n=1 Tax=Hypothenemus hampei TaxID=57062 RepID=A0ABD1EFD1_HYPHA
MDVKTITKEAHVNRDHVDYIDAILPTISELLLTYVTIKQKLVFIVRNRSNWFAMPYARYTPCDYANMHFVYEECQGNASGNIVLEMVSLTYNRTPVVSYCEGKMLVRAIGRRTIISKSTTHRVLKPYQIYPLHVQRIYAFLHREDAEIIACRSKIFWNNESSCKGFRIVNPLSPKAELFGQYRWYPTKWQNLNKNFHADLELRMRMWLPNYGCHLLTKLYLYGRHEICDTFTKVIFKIHFLEVNTQVFQEDCRRFTGALDLSLAKIP